MDMKEITSAQNPIVKQAKQLIASGKFRYKYRQTVLEGIHLCQSYLDAGFKPSHCLLSQGSLANLEVQQLLQVCREKSVELILLTDALYKNLSVVEHGIGIMMIVDIPDPSSRGSLAKSAVLLDNVQDPGNAGAILRTTAAAGLQFAYFSKNSTDPWSPKALRSGMGSHFHLTIYSNVDLLQLVAESTIPILATSLQATQSLFQADLTGEIGWLMGNEGQGVSATLLNKPQITQVIIPQNTKVESLNVAAATAVCLFEHRRQRLLANKTS